MRIHFNGSRKPTVGVEVELQIIDPETSDLVSGTPASSTYSGYSSRQAGVDRLDHRAEHGRLRERGGGAPRADHRLQSLLALCDELGYELASTGTHPFSRWSEQDIASQERYHRLVKRCQCPARRLMIFGLYVHVGIESGKKAIAVFNSLSTYSRCRRARRTSKGRRSSWRPPG